MLGGLSRIYSKLREIYACGWDLDYSQISLSEFKLMSRKVRLIRRQHKSVFFQAFSFFCNFRRLPRIYFDFMFQWNVHFSCLVMCNDEIIVDEVSRIWFIFSLFSVVEAFRTFWSFVCIFQKVREVLSEFFSFALKLRQMVLEIMR